MGVDRPVRTHTIRTAKNHRLHFDLDGLQVDAATGITPSAKSRTYSAMIWHHEIKPFKRLIFPIKNCNPQKFKGWPLAESDKETIVLKNHPFSGTMLFVWEVNLWKSMRSIKKSYPHIAPQKIHIDVT